MKLNLHIIPNWVSLAIAAAFYGVAFGIGKDAGFIMERTGAALFVFVAGMVLSNVYPFGITKLVMAIFLWLGLWQGIAFFGLSMFSCGVYGIVRNRMGNGRDDSIPYSPFAAVVFAVFVYFGGSGALLS